jgi:glycosyltransferase involved in cell wall biosynthesis
MNIGIVTSFYNNYDVFLNRWLFSVIALKSKPAFITIVQSGPKYNNVNIESARKLLKKVNIPFKILKIKKHRGMGFARNWAVKNTPTKYIMYLDVDDLVVPDAINIINFYAKKTKADVICGGLAIKWEDKGLRRNKIYKGITAAGILKNKSCSSHSVYKKALWEKFKYPNNEFCNGYLWLGFAKLQALFVGTDEICTIYMRRRSGHYCTITRPNKKKWKRQKQNFIKKGIIAK